MKIVVQDNKGDTNCQLKIVSLQNEFPKVENFNKKRISNEDKADFSSMYIFGNGFAVKFWTEI